MRSEWHMACISNFHEITNRYKTIQKEQWRYPGIHTAMFPPPREKLRQVGTVEKVESAQGYDGYGKDHYAKTAYAPFQYGPGSQELMS